MQQVLRWAGSGEGRLCLIALLGRVAATCNSNPIVIGLRMLSCEEVDYRGQPFNNFDLGDCLDKRTLFRASRATAVMTVIGNVTTLLSMTYLMPLLMERWGPKRTLLFTAGWPVAKNIVQYAGLVQGGNAALVAIAVISQALMIVSGPLNFSLAAEQYLSELLQESPLQRSPAISRLKGAAVIGDGIGIALGGISADYFGVAFTFYWSTSIFILTTVLASIHLQTLPSPPPVDEAVSKFDRVLGSITALKPQLVITSNGKRSRYFGVLLVGAAAVFSTTAMDFAPQQLRVMATQSFGLNAAEVGYLALAQCFGQAAFLMGVVPQVLEAGRVVTGDVVVGESDPRERGSKMVREIPTKRARFDLTFLRGCVLGEGLVFATISTIAAGQHAVFLCIGATGLVLVSGSHPLYRGVIAALVPDGQETRALAGIAVADIIGAIVSDVVLPIALAHFTVMEVPARSFLVNAAFAFLAAASLAFVRYKRAPGQQPR